MKQRGFPIPLTDDQRAIITRALRDVKVLKQLAQLAEERVADVVRAIAGPGAALSIQSDSAFEILVQPPEQEQE